MQMKSSGFTLKPLVASLQRHRFVPLYLVALGMSAGQLQAAEATVSDDAGSAVSSAAVSADATAAPAPTTQLDRVEAPASAWRYLPMHNPCAVIPVICPKCWPMVLWSTPCSPAC